MLLTDNHYIVNACKSFNDKVKVDGKLIDRFLVPNDFTPKASIKKKYGWEDLADTDIKNSSNKIGEIINLAQMLNSLYWDKKSKGAKEKELFDLYKDICQLDILSCIEIDRCKKLSPVSAIKELKKIRDKEYFSKGYISRNKEKKLVGIRPYFFKFLEGGKDYKFEKYNCGMDNLELVLDKNVKMKEKESNVVYIKDLFDKEVIVKKPDKRKIKKIIGLLKHLRFNQNIVWNSDADNKYELANDLYLECINQISKIIIDKALIKCMIGRIEKGKNNPRFNDFTKEGRRLFNVFYEVNRKEMLKCFEIKINDNTSLIEEVKGDISLYKKAFKIAKSKKKTSPF